MANLPTISLRAIKARIDDRSYQRGEAYFRNGSIFDTRRQGQTIKARCEGSQGGPYRVEAALAGDRVEAAECSCPVGGGGACKHVAALLLTWRARPEEFIEVEDLDTALERRSKPELVALIKQMLRRQPELENLLVTPLPGPGGRGRPANPEVYRRMARSAIRSVGRYDDWGGSPDPDPILETGDGFLQAEDYAAASAVYEGLCVEAIEGVDSFHDEEGEIGRVVSDCVTGLAKCLPHLADDPARREAVFRALFEAYKFTSTYYDIEEDVAELIAEHATDDERKTVAGWARAEISGKPDGWGSRYRNRAYGDLLLTLEGDRLDDEAYLRVCRETGRTEDLINRLLTLGRLDEAVTLLRKAEDVDFLTFAEVFVRHHKGEIAEEFATERAKKEAHGTRIYEWLKRRAKARRDKAGVRRLAEAIFEKRPGLEGYKELREITPRAEWPDLRDKLLGRLGKARDNALLIQIALDEKDVDRALELLSVGKGDAAHLALEVAKAAEAKRPREAARIYRKQAEREIEARSREHYKDACRLLKKARDLYLKLGEKTEWEYDLGVLRERYRSLRALKEEMEAAKL